MRFILFATIYYNLIHQVFTESINGCFQTHIIAVNDTCASVATQFQITETDFYAMNPDLHHTAQQDCDNLDIGKPYCVCTARPCSSGTTAAEVSKNTTLSIHLSSTLSAAFSTISSSITASPLDSLVISSVTTPSTTASSIASAILSTAAPSIISNSSSRIITTSRSASSSTSSMIASTTPEIRAISIATQTASFSFGFIVITIISLITVNAFV